MPRPPPVTRAVLPDSPSNFFSCENRRRLICDDGVVDRFAKSDLVGGRTMSGTLSPESHLATFLAKFTPEVERQARAVLERMRARLPGAWQLVYDNYNALAIAFGANDKLSGVVFSIALYPRWVSLFFARGIELPDPEGLLRGAGKAIRHIVLKDIALFDTPAVQAFVVAALAPAPPQIDPTKPGKLVIKSISAKQRPRRP